MFLTALLQLVYAQKITKINAGSKGFQQEFVSFEPSSAPAFNNKAVVVNEKNEILSQEAIITGKESDKLGMIHYRLQQVINSIPVENTFYVSHVKNGKVIMQNGSWVNNTNTLRTFPGLSEADALHAATSFLGATTYKWQIPGEETFIKNETGDANASFFPKGKLVYYNAASLEEAPNLMLAYKFDIYSAEPLMRKLVYVEAFSGKILGTNDLIHETNATGTASTGFSGTQTITTDSYNGSFRLRETGRGLGIQTYNMKQGTNYNTAVDFTDADNVWNNVNTAKDQYATDAHWGAEKTYDFYFQKFARNSINNAGFAIKSYVHYSRNYFNAFWDGSRMTYGDGSATYGNKPLTSLDVCGHEITHGLTSFTANLTYSNESGAMNEGFSDIFGTAIEWYARPSRADFLIGADFYTIRSMSNPKAYSQPSTYKKQYWYTGTADNGGVHTNSGVLNYWFYLLTNGGTGTNDNSFVYNVSGIGMAKSQAIAYRTLTVYLVASSNYANARTYSIKSAEDLYGLGSNEAVQTKNAWDAVGVGGGLSAAGKNVNLLAKNSTSENMISNVAVYPNPVAEKINISYHAAIAQNSNVQLIDLKGNVVQSFSFNSAKGINNKQLDLSSSTPSGKYWIRLDGKLLGAVIKK